ncbi:hypothetical protein [Kineosporia sp. NBRC 101731]|uniref:hypothetical protein n=1 Tax=Kineosporia sp. NBRC 101731 TaxID=3032199 RepID=UPI0024A35A83|nr:hypothetical protein [Kineosporia sp. NBRC 101731]GLY29098.1 hypothetical protein Kisp02_24630 [Kineosporia sp. NBRC 101731]
MTTTMGTEAEKPAFTIRVPPVWFEFDVWRATRTGDLARLVDTRIAGDTRLSRFRAPLLKALREAAEQAERQGAMICAAMMQPQEEAVLAAMLTVFHRADTPAETVEAIAAQITSTAPGEGSNSWRRVEITSTTAGSAVRVTGVEAVRFGDGSADCVTMQTLIPAPAGGVVNVVLTSPQIELTESWLDLFDAISSTFAWSSETGTTRKTETTEG